MIQHCRAFQVKIHMNTNLWTNLSWNHFSINRLNRFCCFITIAAQISLSPSTDWARYSLKHGIKQPHQPILKQDSCQWHLVLNPSIIQDKTFAPSFVTHSEEAQVSKAVTVIDTPAPALMSHKMARKSLLCQVHLARLRGNQTKS
jgi:hypothetical protein